MDVASRIRMPPRLPLLSAALWLTALGEARPAAVEYTGDGEPTAVQEQARWLLNRARFAPEREADRLGLVNARPGGHPDYDVAEDGDGANQFGGGPAAWAAWQVARAPLAPHAALSQAATRHSRDMAETRLFQHSSPSATYYPLGSVASQRQAAEGYANTLTGFVENLATGASGATHAYPAEGLSPLGAHDNLWIDRNVADRGHRQCMLNPEAREVGVGHWRRQGPEVINGVTYLMTRDYFTQDLGRRPGWHFFTDTLWHDADGNGRYDPGEGVGGVEVRLFQHGVEGAWFDRSAPSGSFAVPLAGFLDGQPVEIRLVHPGAQPVTLTLSHGFAAGGVITLAPASTWSVGSFVQPFGERNAGLRDLALHGNLGLVVRPDGPAATFHLPAGLSFRLDFSPSLTAPQWTPVAEGLAAPGGHTVSGLPGDLGFLRLSTLRDD
jgi:hypothetical protein